MNGLGFGGSIIIVLDLEVVTSAGGRCWRWCCSSGPCFFIFITFCFFFFFFTPAVDAFFPGMSSSGMTDLLDRGTNVPV